MQIAGYTWAGVRTDDFEGTVRFFAETLGLSLERRDDRRGFARFRLATGQELEVFGPGSRYYDLHGAPVLGFEVPDVRAARAELEAAGVTFATEVEEAPDGAAWTYFRGPDGFLYQLTQPGRE